MYLPYPYPKVFMQILTFLYFLCGNVKSQKIFWIIGPPFIDVGTIHIFIFHCIFFSFKKGSQCIEKLLNKVAKSLIGTSTRILRIFCMKSCTEGHYLHNSINLFGKLFWTILWQNNGFFLADSILFSFRKIQQDLASAGVQISPKTVGRRLRESGIVARRPRKLPLLLRRHTIERLAYAHEHRNKPASYFKSNIFI